MTSKTDIVRPKYVKIYDDEDFEKLLEGLSVATCMLTESVPIVDEASVIKRLSALTLSGAAEGNCCSCCGVGPFESRAQQTAHYKHHWHTHNIKRKLFGKAPITLGQFHSRQDDSSVSSSDSETDPGGTSGGTASELFAMATRHCKAFYTNAAGQVFCIYRCLLHHRKEHLSTDGDGKAWVARCRSLSKCDPHHSQRLAILMISGGHFAGAIFSGNVPWVHKTFHSYVSRRGQGQAQAARDSHGSAPRSAGASLRRYNQQQFLEHVQEIIAGWSDDLFACSLIFYRAVGSVNQACLFGNKSPLRRDDPRVRALPFPTRKPSFKEVRRAHETLASVEVYETAELFQKALMLSLASKGANKSGSDTTVASKRPPKASPGKPIDRAKSRERTPRELPTTELPIPITSSEDEGPCYIDSETPVGWIKTLSEQSSKGVITNSRKDLINDINDCSIASSEDSQSEAENTQQRKGPDVKKRKKKKPEEAKGDKKNLPKTTPKIPASIKNMWKLITGKEQHSLETILEGWESSEELETACNTQDPVDGNTALHKAAIAAKPDMVAQLLSAGSDPSIRNHLQQTPYAATPHNDTRIAFRLFQAENPNKYNYAKSHIPGPLTPELLEQEKERKAQQKKAKRQRDKEKQIEKIKMNKFVQLTDAQKLKAEEQRCFLCGAGLPKNAFAYDSFKFCSVQCLQSHRNIRPLHMAK